MTPIGEHIRRLRTQAGLTQAALARAIGLSGNSLISRIESGRAAPTARVLSDLAKFFDQDVEALSAMSGATEDRHSALHLELDVMAKEAARARDKLGASVERMVQEFDDHREVLSNFLVAAKLNLVWALPRKLKREGRAQRVWVLSPALASETDVPEVRTMVKSNLLDGVEYRYLIPERATVIRRAKKLLGELKGPIEIRTAPKNLFGFAVETVIYDAGSDERLSLMIAPTRRPEFDIVVGAAAADRFEAAFKAQWRSASPIVQG